MLLINKEKLRSEMKYLENSTSNYSTNDLKKESLHILNWAVMMGSLCFTGVLIEEKLIEREIQWVEEQIDKFDVWNEFENAAKMWTRHNQLNWILNIASEKVQNEVSVKEPIKLNIRKDEDSHLNDLNTYCERTD